MVKKLERLCDKIEKLSGKLEGLSEKIEKPAGKPERLSEKPEKMLGKIKKLRTVDVRNFFSRKRERSEGRMGL